jgi:hypothetical protein
LLVSIQKAVILCGRISLERQFSAYAGLIKGYENEFDVYPGIIAGFTRILVQDQRNGLQFPGHFIPRHKIQKVLLRFLFLAHIPTAERYFAKSNQLVIPNKITFSKSKLDG